jgi:hypothetical protein
MEKPLSGLRSGLPSHDVDLEPLPVAPVSRRTHRASRRGPGTAHEHAQAPCFGQCGSTHPELERAVSQRLRRDNERCRLCSSGRPSSCKKDAGFDRVRVRRVGPQHQGQSLTGREIDTRGCSSAHVGEALDLARRIQELELIRRQPTERGSRPAQHQRHEEHDRWNAEQPEARPTRRSARLGITAVANVQHGARLVARL